MSYRIRAHISTPVLLALGLCCLLGRMSQAEDSLTRRPNIIFLLTDDQRFDAAGALGNPILETPHLDRLAREGTVFTNAFCTTSICAISRASFITGQYARRHGIVDFATPLSDEAFDQSFPAVLRQAGYRVAFVGKWGLGNPLPKDRYDNWYGYPGQGHYFSPDETRHLTDIQADDALEFLQSCTADQPFCLQVSFKAPHCDEHSVAAFTPSHRHLELYESTTMPLPATAAPEFFTSLPEFLQSSEARTRWVARMETPELFQKTVKDYYRLISGVDEALGAIRQTLADKGLADNTVILFTSDNGFYLGEYQLSGKWFIHEESIRIPLIIHDPRVDPALHGGRRDEMALNIDVAPTIVDLADEPVPNAMQGESLLPLVRGEHPTWRDAWFYEHLFRHHAIPRSEGVRTTQWKYVRYLDQEPAYEGLYNVEQDPHDRHNLVEDADHTEVHRQMIALWERMREELQ